MKNYESPLKDRIVETPEGMIAWNEEQAIIDTTEMICEIMRRKKIKRAMLAEQLGISKSRITQILDGTANITIRTLARVLTVLGYEFRPECDAIHGRNEIQYKFKMPIGKEDIDYPVSGWSNRPSISSRIALLAQ